MRLPNLESMKLIANRQLRGEYGLVVPGQEFEVREEIGLQLLRIGVVERPVDPKITYETKVIVPEAPEVSARHPFRDVPVPDAESEAVASEGDSVLPDADVSESEEGTTHSRGRGRRARSGTGR